MLKQLLPYNIRRIRYVQARHLSSTEDQHVFVEKLTGNHEKIAIIGMRKEASRNAITPTFPQLLNEAVENIRNDNSIWAVILRSFVPGTFCAGLNVKEAVKLERSSFKELTNNLRSAFSNLESLPMPVIAAVDGYALGGGMEITLSCDLRVVADSAKMGQIETQLGLFPAAGASQRLPRLIGATHAKQLMYLSEIIDGKRAEEIGLANYVVPQNQSGDAAYQKSLEIALNLTTLGPIAIRMTKLAVDKGLQVDLSTGLKIEEACMDQISKTEDVLEGIRSVFEKRKPVFKGK